MKRKLFMAYVLALGCLGLFATEPVVPQVKPHQPQIYLWGCVYNVHGELVGFACGEYPNVECTLTNCEGYPW